MPEALGHRHHHPVGYAHPSAANFPSILRMSVIQRLGLAGALMALIWLAVAWAIG
jgi:hypothetical protein